MSVIRDETIRLGADEEHPLGETFRKIHLRLAVIEDRIGIDSKESSGAPMSVVFLLCAMMFIAGMEFGSIVGMNIERNSSQVGHVSASTPRS